ncbi:LmbU family transcriptional regulator [Streptomyces sp. NPDC057743]|uniref:LmbU family transcriptional regulator n=1 Tax=Streptomyces sp. NPDC057743 TaxID=3346236 RepID=UPI003686C500
MRRRTALCIPRGMSLDSWRSLGRQLQEISSSSAWWLGDWLLYGQAEFPNRYKHAIAQTSLDYQTLRNYAWVARRFEPHERHERLSFQHHAEVAGLPQEERGQWLARAAEHGWSRNELRRQVRAQKEITGTSRAAQLKMKPDDGQRELWQAAALHTGKDLLTWITAVLDDASKSTPAINSG